MKKLPLIISLLFILFFYGCGADATQESASAMPSPITAVATPAPTPSLTAAPTPSPTVAATSADLQMQLANAPEIDGLATAIQDDSVIYTYANGNTYGGTAGEYAGVFKEDVFMEGEQVGGVCLAADVCLVLLNNSLAEIPEGEYKIKIAIPMDISDLLEPDSINIFNVISPSSDVSLIMVMSDEKQDLISNMPYDNEQFATPVNGGQLSLISDYNGEFVFNSVPMYNLYGGTREFDPLDAMHYLHYGISASDIALEYNVFASFGDSLGCKTDSMILFLNDKSKAYSIDISYTLTVDGKLVFISTNIIEQ